MSGEDPLAQAIEFHQSGRLSEAEQIYRRILAQQPDHCDALHLLGVLAAQTGRENTAVELIRRALQIRPNFAEAHYNLGNTLKRFGRFTEAADCYRQAIRLKADLPEAHIDLTDALTKTADLPAAIAAGQRAVELSPSSPEAHTNLGNALKASGKFPEAADCYRRAVSHKPDWSVPHSNLGSTLRLLEQLDDAITACSKAIELDPENAEAHNNLGLAFAGAGRIEQALSSYKNALRCNPELAEAHCNLSNALRHRGRIDESIVSAQRAIAIYPGWAEAHNALAFALREARRLFEALAAARQAIRFKPDFVEAQIGLGNILSDLGHIDEAIDSFQCAIALDPNFAEAHSNRGNQLKSAGRLDDAIASYRKAVDLKPEFSEAHSNLICTLQYHPAYDSGAIREELCRWNDRHAAPLKKSIRPHENSRDPARRLRIGYVSPDFRQHVVGHNLLPLFREADHRVLEIFSYSNVAREDGLTRQFQGYSDVWRDIAGMATAGAAEQIRQDKIDILVDLALHTANNRLGIFALKPAPVQVTFAGYPGSTGVEAIDYRLSDRYLDPPDSSAGPWNEQTIRLPNSFWCYDPPFSDLDVNSLPADAVGHVTFGCLNDFCKVNDQVLRTWALVLAKIAESRLMILCPEGSHRQRVLEFLRCAGVDSSRVELIAPRPRREYLELYHRIDIALDTIPYNGHTTSLDSLWMGVPVVTLIGNTVVGRAVFSQLTNLNLTELIADSPAKFVQIAAALARDLPRLSEMRRTLRPRMAVSPLCDARRFARNIEAVYRQIWLAWCNES
jgi:protein O-GlcNAc transferase